MESITASHKPSRFQAVGFFIFSLILATGVLSWYFVFNKGTLNVMGEFPFEVTVGDERRVCTAAPCSFTVPARSYSVSIKKDHYFTETRSVDIKRGGDTEVSYQKAAPGSPIAPLYVKNVQAKTLEERGIELRNPVDSR